MPVMAVSSGIYAVPKELRHRVAHLATLDACKYFMHGLHAPGVDNAWQDDDGAERWPFWEDESIQIHTQAARVVSGAYRHLPEEIWEAIPARAMGAFQRELSRNLHLFGFQPSWGDCPNVRGWEIGQDLTDHWNVRFDDTDAPLWRTELNNTMIFAVQIAHRMGYDRLHFLGCDFTGDAGGYAHLLQILSDWYHIAQDQGMEWFNLSPVSKLAVAFNQEIPQPCLTLRR